MKDWRESSGLLERLLSGRRPESGGDGIVPQPDPVHVVEYMQVPNPGDGNFSNYVAPNITTGMSMQSGDGLLGQEAVDMAKANDWSDESSKGGIAYGPANTDSERDSNRGGY